MGFLNYSFFVFNKRDDWDIKDSDFEIKEHPLIKCLDWILDKYCLFVDWMNIN